MKNLLQKFKENKKLKKRILAVVSTTLAFALFVSSVVVYQKSKQNIKAAENKSQNALEETLKNEQTNEEAESKNLSDAAAGNFENESSSDSALDSDKDVTVPISEKTSEPSTQKKISTGSKKPNSSVQNSVKPNKPASAPANKPTTTTQLAVNTCSHNWKLISYTNGCYVYHCSKCDDYKDEERAMNPNDFMGNKSEYLEFLALVNKARKAEGLKEVQYLDIAQEGANTRAVEIIENFSHTRPNGKRGVSAVGECIVKANISNLAASNENIAGGRGYNTSATDAFNRWMNSSGHRANIMSKYISHIVVAQCAGNWVMIGISPVE